MSRIALNHSSYTNLLSLQQVTRGLNATQQILSTGRKVNSAIDNPSSYYTASSLNNRAKDLTMLLDSMSQKTQTLTSALNGIDSATLFLEQMTSVAEQAILSINGRASFELTPELNNGYSNTQKIVAEYGKDAMAAYATTQFYAPGVDKNDEEFGQGTWYLPAIGELMQVYGTDIEQMTAGGGSTGALGNNKETINETLSTLASRGADAATLTEGYYWSSSERSSVYSWRMKMTDGYRSASSQSKAGNYYVRSFRLVDNCFEADATNKPVIGDVMYADKSWGSASNYDGGKTAVGVITDVHDDGAVTIMSLKDLRFNGAYKADNFDPDHPYTSSSATSAWFTQSEFDVTAVEDYNQSALISALRSGVDEATADGGFSTHTLFNGKANTAAIYAEKGKAALMAYDARIFYAPGVGSSNSTFGKGKWYLPSVGELMNAYGYNFAAVGTGATSGATGAGRDKINEALGILASKGVDAAEMSGEYMSSSEGGFDTSGQDLAWTINFNNGAKYNRAKYEANASRHLRTFAQVDGVTAGAEVGDVMYKDKTYGKADDYDGSKKAVGIITEVAENGTSVKIVSLNDLEFGSITSTSGFDPTNPFHNTYDYSHWTVSISADVSELKNYDVANLLTTMQEDAAAYTESKKISEWNEQYNALLAQFDEVINDSGYNGVNLLKGESMEVTFNEDRNHKLVVTGPDVRSSTLGLNSADWESLSGIRASINELKSAISALRTAANDVGNNASIIQIRQSFTENLVNVLEEGADKLTLADMNEASADMLALQTRQNLAINALSLATMAERNVLGLF